MTAVQAPVSTNPIPKLFARQRRLLQLLGALGGASGKTDFQKLLFLYCQESASNTPYDFVPHKFGAFSFTSYADRAKLTERGLLADCDRWQLTAAGREAIGQTSEPWLTAFVDQCTLRGDDLVADTYRRFPFFATRSEIADRLLAGDEAALVRIASAKRAWKGGTYLQTIGYEGHSLESYLNQLLRADVKVLCDVRRNPLSRKFGFSKKTLASGCEGVGIRYEHLPELGISSDQRQSLDTQADYDALFEEYERTSLPKQGDALAKIRGWVASGERVALTCFEHLPHQCHRHCVADALESQFGKDFAATHL